MQLLTLDQRDFRDRLYEQIPAEWLPDLDDAPNAAAVLDMLAGTWSSHQVIDRTVQFDVNSATVLLDGVFNMPVGTAVLGPGIIGNPTVVRSTTQVIPTVLSAVVHPAVNNSPTIVLNGTGGLAAGMTVTGLDIVGDVTVVSVTDSHTVLLSSAQSIADHSVLVFTGIGPTYQTVTLSSPQVIQAGTRLQFKLPDTIGNGLIEALNFMQEQSRLQTSTGLFLDLWGQDFFGTSLQRHVDETDESYRHRLLVNVLAPRVSRCSVFCGMSNLTGFDPIVIEPRNTGDCGAYSTLGSTSWSHIAYNKAGYYGSMLMPFQYFMRATRPTGAGIPLVNGYSMASGGYATIPQPFGYIGASRPGDMGTGEYISLADLENNRAVTDNDIYQMAAECSAAGVTAWVNISSDIESEIRAGGLLDVSFYLDLTTLSEQLIPVGAMFGVGIPFHMNAVGLVVDEVAAGLSSIRIQAAGVFSNPIPMNGSGTLTAFNMHAVASIDTHLMTGASDVIPIMAIISAVNADNFILSPVSLPALAAAANIAAGNTLVGIGQFQLQAVTSLGFANGISMGALSAYSYVTNGTAGVNYVSQTFTTGQSDLVPPGGFLGQSLLLGVSKLGFSYGY